MCVVVVDATKRFPQITLSSLSDWTVPKLGTVQLFFESDRGLLNA